MPLDAVSNTSELTGLNVIGITKSDGSGNGNGIIGNETESDKEPKPRNATATKSDRPRGVIRTTHSSTNVPNVQGILPKDLARALPSNMKTLLAKSTAIYEQQQRKKSPTSAFHGSISESENGDEINNEKNGNSRDVTRSGLNSVSSTQSRDEKSLIDNEHPTLNHPSSAYPDCSKSLETEDPNVLSYERQFTEANVSPLEWLYSQSKERTRGHSRSADKDEDPPHNAIFTSIYVDQKDERISSYENELRMLQIRQRPRVSYLHRMGKRDPQSLQKRTRARPWNLENTMLNWQRAPPFTVIDTSIPYVRPKVTPSNASSPPKIVSAAPPTFDIIMKQVNQLHGYLSDHDISGLLTATNYTRRELYWLFIRFKSLCAISPKGPYGIDCDTFKKGVSRLAVEDERFVQRVFHLVDNDGSGAIEWKEFLTAISALEKGSAEVKARFCFQIYDLDGDGWISRQDLAEMFYAGAMLGNDVSSETSEATKEVVWTFVEKVLARFGEEVVLTGKISLEILLNYMKSENGIHLDIFDVFGRSMLKDLSNRGDRI